jgi:hypothetical protein
LKRVVELGDSKKTITSEDLPFIIAEVLEGKDYDYGRSHRCTHRMQHHLADRARRAADPWRPCQSGVCRHRRDHADAEYPDASDVG